MRTAAEIREAAAVVKAQIRREKRADAREAGAVILGAMLWVLGEGDAFSEAFQAMLQESRADQGGVN